MLATKNPLALAMGSVSNIKHSFYTFNKVCKIYVKSKKYKHFFNYILKISSKFSSQMNKKCYNMIKEKDK
ncbi:hypothetical protein QGO_1563 [Clostridioides difficile CD212]|nr:hypothetical protein QGO_1563 [Clostridioides difficile CD212]EQG44640.1 hypothetical protein QIU_1662 [Clostridioides difficile DA00132]EQJ72773.1 hypothetical protein QSY_1697 [Clostridioides difficile P36]PPV22413.1 hypothetical protein AWN75_15505 [Clostridioides difficile]